jgi:putative DNA primase/helicase
VILTEVLPRLEGVRRHPGYYVARCPAHTDRNPSLSIREGEDGKVLLKCFAGCLYEAIRDALGEAPIRRPSGASIKSYPRLDDAGRSSLAQRLWYDSKPAKGTAVEVYLRSRGIAIEIPPTLRFQRSLRHQSGLYLPAMVAAVQNADGTIVAIHRTFLKGDGSGKAAVEFQKMMLGPCAGGAVRFGRPASVIAIAEGIETALSIAQACPDLAVWAALSASGIRALRLPQVVGEVIIAADGDDAGESAAQVAAQRFLREGRLVRIGRPIGSKDFNEMRL